MTEDHFGPECPECCAAADSSKALGHLAAWLEKALADGIFERMGYENAMERERRVLEAFLQSELRP